MASMYVRVKRQKTTIFLYTDPSETIGDLKQKIAHITGTPSTRQRLFFQDKVTEDFKTIGELKIENENILYLVYRKDDSSDDWEPIEIASSMDVDGKRD